MNDPIAKAIHELIDHSVNTDQRLEQILEQLKKLGAGLRQRSANARKLRRQLPEPDC